MLIQIQCGPYIYFLSVSGSRGGNSRGKKIMPFWTLQLVSNYLCNMYWNLSVALILLMCSIVKYLRQRLNRISLWHTKYTLEHKKHSTLHCFQYMKQERMMSFCCFARMRKLDWIMEKAENRNCEILWNLSMLKLVIIRSIVDELPNSLMCILLFDILPDFIRICSFFWIIFFQDC
jgi:hypothetical protein